MTKGTDPPPRRKGARRMSEIPPDVLAALNEGREETITLVEWLAVDMARLAGAVVPALRLGPAAEASLIAAAQNLAKEPVTVRTRGMGAAIHAHLETHPMRGTALDALASHRSDLVRSWAAYARMADPAPDLETRLATMLRFASDPHMGVRETAWDALRPHLAAELPKALGLLGAWVRDGDHRVRRCAVEATRPRGVWTFHLRPLVADPAPGLPLLEPLRADPSDYVRRSVANWLNDASKSHPDWVRAVCGRWLRESGAKETAWIANHATRTLRKQGAAKKARKAGAPDGGSKVAAPKSGRSRRSGGAR